MTVFKLPDLGEGLSEAEILRWHVGIGDCIELDAPLLSVETAKAVVEVPSPVAGRIALLHAQPGDRLAIGAPLVEFETDSAAASESVTVVGQMPDTLESAAPTAAPCPPVAPGGAVSRTRALPATRLLARSLGVDLASLHGSGNEGLITLEDVIAAGIPRPPAVIIPSTEAGRSEPLRSLRHTMSQSMAVARDNVMQCTVFDDADLFRWQKPDDYMSRALRAIVAGVRAEPALNAWFDAAASSRILFQEIDVGIAVDTADGLLTPVIRQVQQHDLPQLRTALDRLRRAAQQRTLAASELHRFTFMLSNFGSLAGRYATPVVVPPAVAILGTGRAGQDVVAVGSRVEIHRRLPLSLTFDHRAVTGGEAVRFLAAVITDLELPE